MDDHREQQTCNVVTSQTLRAVGVASVEISRAVDCCLIRVCRGVYSIAVACTVPRHARIRELITDTVWTDRFKDSSIAEQIENREIRAQLARLEVIHYPHYRRGDVVSGVSAALLHDLPMFDLPLRPLTVMHSTASTLSPAIRRFRRTVPSADRAILSDVEVTSSIRTSLDLIEYGGPVAGFAALEATLRRGVHQRYGLKKRLGFANPRVLADIGRNLVAQDFAPAALRLARGRRRAVNLLAHISPLSESYAESRSSFNLHFLGLHDFDQQWNVAHDGDFLTRLDFLHRQSMTALAVDGSGKYEEFGRSRLKRESYQHNMLLTMGYKVVHFAFRDILNPQVFGAKLFQQAPELLKFRGKPLRL